MNCPKCKKSLTKTLLNNVEVDYCSICLGVWFEEDELRLSKDNKDKDLSWLDVDLWKDKTKFKIARGSRMCPSCRVPFYEVYYGDSNVVVDICNVCHGVWLDRAEYKKIISWLKEKANYEILNKYAKNLLSEAGEIFSGPEVLRDEIEDFLTILKLINYKFLVQYPTLSKIIMQLPK